MTLTNAELAILSLVAETPRHGYEIEQVIERRGMREWTEVGFSSIYYLLKKLETDGLSAAAIHGNKSQGARTRALSGFRDGTLPVLVATDIAARGLDIDGLPHVVNFELPHVPEDYVHRIGRTGRAGAAGVAISFCFGEERPLAMGNDEAAWAKNRRAHFEFD